VSSNTFARRRPWIAVVLFGGAVGLACWSADIRLPEALRGGRTSAMGAGSERPEELDWKQVRAALAVPRRADSELREASVEDPSDPAAIYLAGIDRLGRGEASAALAVFDRIPADEIPLDLAYAPYRLHSALRPDVPGPHAARLLEAALGNELPHLVEARVLAQEGHLPESLAAYRATDPVRWTRHDVSCLEMVAHHGALKPDLDSTVWRAIARRGADDPLEEDLRALVKGKDTDEMEQRLRSRLASDPEAREIAVRSLWRMREARRLFMERRYGDLLEGFGDAQPTGVTTEISTILFLAALELGEAHYAYRWGQELKRRHPDRELARWVANLTSNLRSSQ
jgi:hypothetical protein